MFLRLCTMVMKNQSINQEDQVVVTTRKNKDNVLQDIKAFDISSLRHVRVQPKELDMEAFLVIMYKMILYALFRFGLFMMWAFIVYILPTLVYVGFFIMIRVSKKLITMRVKSYKKPTQFKKVYNTRSRMINTHSV